MFEELGKDLPETINFKPSRKDFSRPAAYALLHPSSGKAYVGSTQDLYKRLNQHRTRLLAGQHRNPVLQEAFDIDPHFDLRYIPAKNRNEALEIEQNLLDRFHPSGMLFNIGLDATNHQRGRPVSEETKSRLKKKAEEQFSTDESRKRHSEIIKEKWKDPEYRAKGCGRTYTEDRRKEIGEATRKLWNDPGTREKMLSHRKSDEFRQRISELKSKPIMVNGTLYPNAKTAGLAHGKSESWARLTAKKQLNGDN